MTTTISAARDRAADLLAAHVSRSFGDALRAETSPHNLLAEVRRYDDGGLPGVVADALGDLASACIPVVYGARVSQ
jgi:hypothetical protein